MLPGTCQDEVRLKNRAKCCFRDSERAKTRAWTMSQPENKII